MELSDYELLSAYIDGALDDSERTALESRLITDAELRRELAALRQTVRLVNSLPTLKAPRNFTITAQMVGAPIKPRSRLIQFALPLATAAAVLMLAFFGLSYLLSSQANNTGGGAPNPAGVALIPTSTVNQTESQPSIMLATEELDNAGNGASDLGSVTTENEDQETQTIPGDGDETLTREIAEDETDIAEESAGEDAASQSMMNDQSGMTLTDVAITEVYYNEPSDLPLETSPEGYLSLTAPAPIPSMLPTQIAGATMGAFTSPPHSTDGRMDDGVYKSETMTFALPETATPVVGQAYRFRRENDSLKLLFWILYNIFRVL